MHVKRVVGSNPTIIGRTEFYLKRNQMDRKYKIIHEIKKFNEVYGDDAKPSVVRQYQNDKGEIVEHEDITNELLLIKVLINGKLYQSVITFGEYGITGNNKSLDTMTAREFIEECLRPNDALMSNAIERDLNPKEIPQRIKDETAKEFEEIKNKLINEKKKKK